MTYTVKDIMQKYRVGETSVLSWINSGELSALDVSRKKSKRPSWRITEEGLAQFELSRTKQPPQPHKRNRRKTNSNVIEFY